MGDLKLETLALYLLGGTTIVFAAVFFARAAASPNVPTHVVVGSAFMSVAFAACFGYFTNAVLQFPELLTHSFTWPPKR